MSSSQFDKLFFPYYELCIFFHFLCFCLTKIFFMWLNPWAVLWHHIIVSYFERHPPFIWKLFSIFLLTTLVCVVWILGNCYNLMSWVVCTFIFPPRSSSYLNTIYWKIDFLSIDIQCYFCHTLKFFNLFVFWSLFSVLFFCLFMHPATFLKYV